MSRNRYPKLLLNKATILVSLTRYDLVVIGCSYLVLSWMRASGSTTLIINVGLLVLISSLKGRIPKGFFSHINDQKLNEWGNKLSSINRSSTNE